MRYFDGRTYEWVGLSRQPNIISKVCSLDVKGNELPSKAYGDITLSFFWHLSHFYAVHCVVYLALVSY